MYNTMKKLIEYELFCCYKSPAIKWLIIGPSILAILLWCYVTYNGYQEITKLSDMPITYCLYGIYLNYIARFGTFISIIFILMAATPFFMDKQARGDMILKTLPESASKRCIARYIQLFILSLTALLLMLFTVMAMICVTNLLIPEFSLSLYDRRLQFIEYGARLILNMMGIVLIQTSAHFIVKSPYVPIAFGCIMAFLTNSIYNPFAAMTEYFNGNVPLL